MPFELYQGVYPPELLYGEILIEFINEMKKQKE